MRSRFKDGFHPSELWGIAKERKTRTRGDKARARRRARKACARDGRFTLREYLRRGAAQ